MAGRPKMCGSCGKLMGVAEVCPYCGADQKKVGVRLRQAARGAGRDVSGVTVTAVLVGINVFLFLVAIAIGGIGAAPGGLEILAPDSQVIWQLGMQDNAAIMAGDWWRLITPIFLHLGLLHVGFNCYLAWVAGRWLEADFGAVRVFVIYMVAGIFGFVLSYYAGLDGAGASGSVSGLLGAVLVRRRLVDGHFRHPITLWVLQLIVLNVILGFAFPMINNVAHGGGFVAGAGLSLLFTKGPRGSGMRSAVLATSGLLAVITAVAFVMMLLSLGRPLREDAVAVDACFVTAMNGFSDGGRSVSDIEGRRALKCFDELTGLHEVFRPFADRMSGHVRDALVAKRAGELRQEQQAVTAAEAEFRAFRRMLDEQFRRWAPTYVR